MKKYRNENNMIFEAYMESKFKPAGVPAHAKSFSSLDPDEEGDYNVAYIVVPRHSDKQDIMDLSYFAIEPSYSRSSEFPDVVKVKNNYIIGFGDEMLKVYIGRPAPDSQTELTSVLEMIADIFTSHDVTSSAELKSLIDRYTF